MKVVLINPPSPYLANDAAYPPSGLMYVAAVLENIGDEATIVDLTGGVNWEQIVSEIEADLVGIACVTPNFKMVREIASLVPANKPIVIGGVHPTFLPEDTLLNIRCDSIVRGEAEEVIKELMEDLEKGSLKRIYDGGLAEVRNIPKPARHLVDLHKYSPGGEASTPIYTSRGCPFNCNFCSKISGRKYRVIPIKRVLDEIREVMKLGFRHVVFGDDDIAIYPERIKELMRTIKNIGLDFRLNQDARIIDDEAIRMAKRAGCQEISFGIESGSQKMLDLMHKRTTVEANKRAIRITKRHGIKAKAYFMVNFPGENEKTVGETLKFAKEVKPDKWLLSSFVPLPGSDTFHNSKKYGIIWMSSSWEDYYLVGKDGNFKPCFETAELSRARQIYLHKMLYTGLKEILG